jgi:hypothetical protein
MPKLELGPAGFLPPSAASMGIFQPEKGSNMDLVEGEHVPTEKAIEKAAHELLTRRNPTLFPGPMIVWGWNEETRHKAKLMLDMAKEIPGVNIIPMPDYRPIYPKIDPDTNCYTQAWCAYDGHEDALLSLRDLDSEKLLLITAAIKKAKKSITPWALTSEGKEELEEIRYNKERLKAQSKEDATLFMGELHQGLDENQE